MILKGPELNKLSHLISQQVEQVTCLECCKTYVAPETALCGHTLCHLCWKKRRTCPQCSTTVNRQSTKLNLALQNLTEHINTLGETFEKVFNIKLDEFMLDTPGEFASRDDPSKNVKEWLASSQNHFSAPITPSEQASQEKSPVAELQVQSKVLVHTSTVVLHKPTKVVCATIAQDDWDKIEPMTETVDKDKENVVGPIDTDLFDINDNSYTMQNPRRSLRKKDGKIIDFINIQSQSSSEKPDSKEKNTENDNKTSSIKQNWNNVKRMRKEFSKLNKKNKNKLNVSIEMYKKTQQSSNKSNIDIPVAVSEQVLEIDDNTPNGENERNSDLHTADNLPQRDCSSNPSKAIYMLDNPDRSDNNMKKHLEKNTNKSSLINAKSITTAKQIVISSHTPSQVNNKQFQESSNNFNEPNKSKIAFIKKAPLSHIHNKHTCNNATTYHYIDVKPGGTNSSNDIQISIKIGDRVTNIIINKDKNDSPLKASTDREVQVSLGPYKISASNNNCLEVEDQTKSKINNEMAQKIVINTDNKLLSTDKAGTPANKSISTKKNTASAETATAQFEITESVERELSKIMECENINDEQCNFCNISNNKTTTQVGPTIHLDKSKNINILSDIQINNYKTKAQDENVQLLQNTNKGTSEILLPSIHTNKYKNADKRSRETTTDCDLPKSKKMKTISEDIGEMCITNSHTSHCDKNDKNESELVTYEAVIDQVFGNIDKDIENEHRGTPTATSKIGTVGKDVRTLTQKSKIVSIPGSNQSESFTNIKDYYDQKESENMFSLGEKDNENGDRTLKNIVRESTQQQVHNLLTPVMCRNLELQEYTPHIDDKDDESDKSIVEDTPQKNVSYSKLRQKNESSINKLEQKLNPPEKDEKKTVVKQKSRSVINLTESVEFNKSNKDGTIIECVTKKHALETPLTINKFVDHIKHKSTPVARKSLNFENENTEDEDPEITLCPTSDVAKNTQEKEFMTKAFENTPESPRMRSLALKNLNTANNKRLCIAGSCLTSSEITKLKNLCASLKWVYVDKYTKDVTHLVVGVDEDYKSQRSVKYMSALAAGKWIVSFEWVEKCLKAMRWVDEVKFEVLDSTGEPGPKRSRIAKRKLFQGITFYCMPPFSVLDVNTLKILQWSSVLYQSTTSGC
ncbi:putative leucine-rich repeat-containing protein DDB_G0290503 isoform X2 [Manduca sexta]|uniref:putative leucine-rich repeat-containing protein DDB_G0290503 isoform X2 n=1 Tax=Manduca sexta TaxID=7130 RepID=UPI0018900974|nr:putative leucine-rich repeat-containing protein DDB_G0290503 isoform X2 [Manduca sexta]